MIVADEMGDGDTLLVDSVRDHDASKNAWWSGWNCQRAEANVFQDSEGGTMSITLA